MRLSQATVDSLPTDVTRPRYRREELRTGIVHVGPGAFHRAHQAVYTDDILGGESREWGIAGVSLHSDTVRNRLMPQDCLYTVCERRGNDLSMRLIAAIREAVVAVQEPDRTLALLASPDTHLVTLTVTEKGYLRAADLSLDTGAPAVTADLIGAWPPTTIYGWLAETFRRRRAMGLTGLTLMSCDNLTANGAQLARLTEEFLQRAQPDLVQWFRRECTCPSSMVDRIVPAPRSDSIDFLERRLGQRDEAAVFTERYRQWIIEDRFAGRRPLWELAGAQLVGDVTTHELMKLRLLNGAHSALAYLGLFAGHQFVHEAAADHRVRVVVERLMRIEATGSLHQAAPATHSYVAALLERFDNPALQHQLTQIAADGSQKIQQRWLPVLRFHAQRATSCPALLRALAAWMAYTRADRFAVIDPLREILQRLWADVGQNGMAAALFGQHGYFHDQWIANDAELAFLNRELANFIGAGP